MYKKSVIALCVLTTLFACKKDNNEELKALSAPPATLEGTYTFIGEDRKWFSIGRFTDNGNFDSAYWGANYVSINNGGELTISPTTFYYDSIYYHLDADVVNQYFHNGVPTTNNIDHYTGVQIDKHITTTYTLVGTDSVSLSPAVETLNGPIDGFHLSWSGDTLIMYHQSQNLTDTIADGELFYWLDYQSLTRKYIKK